MASAPNTFHVAQLDVPALRDGLQATVSALHALQQEHQSLAVAALSLPGVLASTWFCQGIGGFPLKFLALDIERFGRL